MGDGKDDEDVLLVSGCGDEKRGMLLNFHDEVKKHTLMMTWRWMSVMIMMMKMSIIIMCCIKKYHDVPT
ncbi:hypothetical protein AtEden1_Chr3g0178311 [Arabidopsis thaliana]